MLDTRRPRRPSGYLMEQVTSSIGEFALLDPEGRLVVRVNPSVGVIWGLCDGQRTIQEIVRLLIGAYPEGAATMDSDVREALITLTEHGAVEWVR